MAHLLSSNRQAVLDAGKLLDMQCEWIQYKELKDVATGNPVDSWHWDLLRERLSRAVELAGPKVPILEGRP